MRRHPSGGSGAPGAGLAAGPIAVLALAALAAPAGGATWDVPAAVPTIAAALDSAASGDTVRVACGTYFEHDLALRSGVVLRGATGDPACVTIDGGQLGRVLDGANLDETTRLEGLTITGGRADTTAYWENAGGGLRLDDSRMAITDCVFTGNRAKYGGGLAVREGAVRLTDTAFASNFAEGTSWAAGGGIYAVRGAPELLRCSFTGNDASAIDVPGDGGGIFADQTLLTATDCTFGGNSADAGAGGFYSFRVDRSVLVRCTFTGNVANAGGAAYLETSYSRWKRCDFEGNSAANGGALFSAKSSVATVEECTFAGNVSSNSGGAIDCWATILSVTDCVIADNEAGLRGGGLTANSTSTMTVEDCLVVRNRALTDGGGLRASNDATVTVRRTSFVANEALGSGGGLHAEDAARVDLEQSLVAHSDPGAAATCTGTASVTLTCSSVWGNAGGDWVDCLVGQELQGGNVADDPRLCGVADSVYTVRIPDSPLLADNNGCGLPIGALGGGCGCPSGATVLVPDDHATIAAALAAAGPGDVVGVCDGTWSETLDLRGGVHLVGLRSDLAIVTWPAGGATDALVRAPAGADSTVIEGLGLDGAGVVDFVLAADSASTGLEVRNNRITGGAVGGVRVGSDSRLVLGGTTQHANDLFANGGVSPLHLRNENTLADSLDARLNWWGTTEYWSAIVPAIEGPVRSCPITDSTHTSALCGPPSAVASPIPAVERPGLSLAAGPNPSREAVRIVFAIPEPAAVRLAVHDVAGRRIAEVRREALPAGRHDAAWTGRDREGRPVAPGVYFLRLEAGERSVTRKVVRLP